MRDECTWGELELSQASTCFRRPGRVSLRLLRVSCRRGEPDHTFELDFAQEEQRLNAKDSALPGRLDSYDRTGSHTSNQDMIGRV